MNQIPSLIKLIPHVATPVWGGERLATLKNIEIDDCIGETWEISRHHKGSATTEEGQKLSELFDEEQLPYLVKFIDTKKNLSVQVHPDDTFAKKYESSQGKTECWIILDAKPGAGIYLGIKNGVSLDDFQQGLLSKRNMAEYLDFHKVQKGDFFFVPAGTAHAIGEDVFLVEIQQSSGITYRVWDWNRMGKDGKPRELHIEKALKVIRFDDSFNNPENFKIQRNLFNFSGRKKLISHEQFNLFIYKIREGDREIIDLKQQYRCAGIVNFQGELHIKKGDCQLSISDYQSMIVIPDGKNIMEVQSVSEESSFILIT